MLDVMSVENPGVASAAGLKASRILILATCLMRVACLSIYAYIAYSFISNQTNSVQTFSQKGDIFFVYAKRACYGIILHFNLIIMIILNKLVIVYIILRFESRFTEVPAFENDSGGHFICHFEEPEIGSRFWARHDKIVKYVKFLKPLSALFSCTCFLGSVCFFTHCLQTLFPIWSSSVSHLFILLNCILCINQC